MDPPPAIRRPTTALQTKPLTVDDYFDARMISDPLCLLDYTMESDGAVAVVTASASRARDLRQPPVYIMGSAHGGIGRTGPLNWKWLQMPDEYLVSSGSAVAARRMYEMAGVQGDVAREALRLAAHKLPLRTRVLERKEA